MAKPITPDTGQLVPMIQQARENPGPAAHTLTCPRGESLDHEGHNHKHGVRVNRSRCHCRDCPVRKQCTRGSSRFSVE